MNGHQRLCIHWCYYEQFWMKTGTRWHMLIQLWQHCLSYQWPGNSRKYQPLDLCGLSRRRRVYIDGKAPGLWWYEWPRTDLWLRGTLPPTVNKWLQRAPSQSTNVLRKVSSCSQRAGWKMCLERCTVQCYGDRKCWNSSLRNAVAFAIQNQLCVRFRRGNAVRTEVRLNTMCRAVK